jgi:hypothetical protein
MGTTITYSGTGVTTSGSTVEISAGGDFTVTGTLTNGMIYVNTTYTMYVNGTQSRQFTTASMVTVAGGTIF